MSDPEEDLDALKQEVARLRAELAKASARVEAKPPVPEGMTESRDWEAVLHTLPDHAMVLSHDGTIQDLNYREQGLSREEVIGRSVFSFISDRFHGAARECFQSVWSSGLPSRYQSEHITPDGETRQIDTQVSALLRQGRTAALMSFGRDITNVRRAKQDLLANTILLSHTEELAHIGTWQLDLERNVLTWSDENFRIFKGEVPRDKTGETYETFLSYVHPDDREMVDKTYMTAVDSGTPYECIHRVLLPDGTVRTVHEKSIEVRDETGASIRSVGFTQDITTRVEAEEEKVQMERRLQNSQRLESLGTLAGGVAHDFNNLLMGVLGNADLALSRISPDSPIRADLRAIEAASNRAADLAKQMLAYSGKGHFVLEEMRFRDLLEEMHCLLETSLPTPSHLHVELMDNPPVIDADVGQMRQIVISLVTNASEAYAHGGGVITIRDGVTECDQAYLKDRNFAFDAAPGRYAYLEVSDTGVGMDDETLARVFDPFFSTKFAGRGLGLAAVQGIVRGHRGLITIRSSPGEGTRVRILVPVVDAPASVRALTGSQVEAENLEGARILLVDDEPVVRDVAQLMLANLGADVVTASDGREAVEVFEADLGHFDMIIVDLTMPHLDGIQTFRAMKKIKPAATVVLSSGFHEDELKQRFKGLGFTGFLQKPYDTKTLLHTLRGCLRGGGTSSPGA
jgi:PAS domain S-box-containing protein